MRKISRDDMKSGIDVDVRTRQLQGGLIDQPSWENKLLQGCVADPRSAFLCSKQQSACLILKSVIYFFLLYKSSQTARIYFPLQRRLR